MSVHVHYEGGERCPVCAHHWRFEDTRVWHVHVSEVNGGFHVNCNNGGPGILENWPSGTAFLSWWRKPVQILTLCGFNYVYQYPKAWRLPTAIKAAQRFCEIEQAKENRTRAALAAMSRSAA